MSRPPMDWRDPSVTRTQAMRDLDALPWAPRDPSVSLSKLVIFGLTPICVAVWAAERFL